MTPETFRLVADPFPDPALLVTAAGEVVAANRSATELLRRVQGGLPGRHLAGLTATPPEDVAAFLRSCSRTSGKVPGVLTVVAADGSPAAYRAEGSLVRPGVEAGVALVLVRLVPKEAAVGRFLALNQRVEELSREVARRKQAEADLRAERERLRVTLSSIGDAVIATDTGGVLTFLNPVAEALTGWRLAEAVGRPHGEVFVAVDEYTREPRPAPLDRVFREGVVVGLANHTVLVSRDGSERPVDDSAAPIRDADGRVVGAILVFRDVTERRRMEMEMRDRAERLAEANRHKDDFLAMLAHELRNPLAPALNGLYLLRLGGADPATSERALGMMERQLRHMARLVDDLLDVSRLARGKFRVERERVDLAALARTAAEDRRPAAERAGVGLTVSVPEAPLWVDGDSTRLVQVVGNLLDNALKFNEPGGTADVSVSADGAEGVVRVRDTGVGIDSDLLPLLFEPFRQADRSLDRSKGGLGLGLALARGLVELHGGRVEAHSRGPGTGSEFVVRLPLAPPGAGRPPVAPTPGPDRHVRVLVVEDNQDAADSLATLLELLGYEVTVAYTGPDGVRRAEEWAPDVVVSDIGLPGLDGYGVATAIRRHPALSGVTLVALTGYGSEGDRRRAEASGFDHVLVKPAGPDALRGVLRRRGGPS